MGIQDRTPPTAEEYDRWRTDYSNWGRWGDDDELGTLNFVTDDVRRAAAELVQDGRVVSCARSIDTKPGPANPYPARHMVAMQDSGAMCDHLSLFIHGFTETHLDALCHLPVEEGNDTWNGQQLDQYGMPLDAPRHHRLLARRHRHPRRALRHPAPPRHRVRHPGRTGARLGARRRRRRAGRDARSPATRCSSAAGTVRTTQPIGERPGFGGAAGVHASCVEFLHDTEASMLVWDMQDAPPPTRASPTRAACPMALHVHHILLPYMGMPILDNADFEALATRAPTRTAGRSSSSSRPS